VQEFPSNSTPALDGLCDDADYAASNQILLKQFANTQASVRLLGDSSSVWACFTGLITGTLTPGAYVGVRIDVNHSCDTFAQPTDYGFFVGEDGRVLTTADNGSGGLLAQVNSAGSTWRGRIRRQRRASPFCLSNAPSVWSIWSSCRISTPAIEQRRKGHSC